MTKSGYDKQKHIDAVRDRFGITLEDVSNYNGNNKEKIADCAGIFNINDTNAEKLFTLLYMLSDTGNEAYLQKFRAEAGLNDSKYVSYPSLFVEKYGIELTAALIFNHNFYAMAINYKRTLETSVKEKTTAFPKTARFALAAAVLLIAVFSVFFIFRSGNVTGNKLTNDWIISLIAPDETGEDARIGIRSPLAGQSMSANDNSADINAAIKKINKAIKDNEENCALYNERGIIYALHGYMENAITDFNMAIEIAPYNSSAHFNRALAYTGINEIENAVKDLYSALSINPMDSEAYYALGVLYFRDYEKSISKPKVLLENAIDSFKQIQGYKDADIIIDYLSKLM